MAGTCMKFDDGGMAS